MLCTVGSGTVWYQTDGGPSAPCRLLTMITMVSATKRPKPLGPWLLNEEGSSYEFCACRCNRSVHDTVNEFVAQSKDGNILWNHKETVSFPVQNVQCWLPAPNNILHFNQLSFKRRCNPEHIGKVTLPPWTGYEKTAISHHRKHRPKVTGAAQYGQQASVWSTFSSGISCHAGRETPGRTRDSGLTVTEAPLSLLRAQSAHNVSFDSIAPNLKSANSCHQPEWQSRLRSLSSSCAPSLWRLQRRTWHKTYQYVFFEACHATSLFSFSLSLSQRGNRPPCCQGPALRCAALRSGLLRCGPAHRWAHGCVCVCFCEHAYACWAFEHASTVLCESF